MCKNSMQRKKNDKNAFSEIITDLRLTNADFFQTKTIFSTKLPEKSSRGHTNYINEKKSSTCAETPCKREEMIKMGFPGKLEI
jgi:hypothetical protein